MKREIIEKFTIYFHAKTLNDKYNLLNDKQRENVKRSVYEYKQPVVVAIEQAFFFNKIACDNIREYVIINSGVLSI